jgi:ferric-dicitrate binding protein FerR (iron transport regulator)
MATGDVLDAGPGAVALRLEDEGLAALRVDAHSRLRWRGAHEFELLAGRVYVDSGASADSAARALEIVVGEARVRHVGTQYLTAREGNTARVLVREGRVRIDLDGGGAELGRGEAAAFATTGGAIRSGTANLRGTDWSWAEALAPRLLLEGRDLRGVLVELARETGRPLQFATQEAERQASETILHGPALDVPPGEALRTLLATSGFVAATDSTTELVIATR